MTDHVIVTYLSQFETRSLFCWQCVTCQQVSRSGYPTREEATDAAQRIHVREAS